MKSQATEKNNKLLATELTEDIEKMYKEITIESLDKLDFHLVGPGYIYRGQANKEWELEPAIYRKDTKTFGREKDFERMLIGEFQKKWLLPTPESTVKTISNYWHILSVCQHYRIPTPILDWTFDWRIAAFFATEGDCEEVDRKYDNHDGAVWFLNRREYEKRLNALCVKNKCANRYENISQNMGEFDWSPCQNNWAKCNPIFFIDAGTTDLRMLVQSSVFSYSLNGINNHCPCICDILGNESKTYFQKFIIPKESKKQFRTELQKFFPKDKINPTTSDNWFKDITNNIIQSIDNSIIDSKQI